MQDLKDLKSRFFKIGFAAANEHRRFPVARGPSDALRACERVPPAIVAWRGTGPRPTVKGGVLRPPRGRLRSGDRKLQSTVAWGPLGCPTRMRAGSPRDRCVARDRPSPYGK